MIIRVTYANLAAHIILIVSAINFQDIELG